MAITHTAHAMARADGFALLKEVELEDRLRLLCGPPTACLLTLPWKEGKLDADQSRQGELLPSENLVGFFTLSYAADAPLLAGCGTCDHGEGGGNAMKRLSRGIRVSFVPFAII